MPEQDAPAQVRQLFDGKAAGWRAKHAPDDPMAGRLHTLGEAVRDAIPPGGTVLDLGCGTGELARHLAAGGLRVTGCDISPSMLAGAGGDGAGAGGAGTDSAADGAGGGAAGGAGGPSRASGTTDPAVRWMILDPDWRTLPFRNSTFDAVVLSSVLEYMPDPVRVLSECARVLRPGAAVHCTVPDLRHPVRWAEGAGWLAARWCAGLRRSAAGAARLSRVLAAGGAAALHVAARQFSARTLDAPGAAARRVAGLTRAARRWAGHALATAGRGARRRPADAAPGRPVTTKPDAGTPGSGTPDSGTRGNGKRGSGRPVVTSAGGGTPGSGTPGSGTPGSGTPGSGTPGSGTPGTTAPGREAPGRGAPVTVTGAGDRRRDRVNAYLAYLRLSRQRHTVRWWRGIAALAGLRHELPARPAGPRLPGRPRPLRLLVLRRPTSGALPAGPHAPGPLASDQAAAPSAKRRRPASGVGAP